MRCPPQIGRLARTIGSGTHGTVYEIRDKEGNRFALKIFKDKFASDESATECLKALADLNHPHVLSPDRIGHTETGELFLTFRYIDVMDSRKPVIEFGPSLAMALLIQASSGLAWLHRHKVLHADIKPSNILTEKASETDHSNQLCLMLSDIEVTKSAGVQGTLGYLAPEVLQGDELSPGSDVFALGAWFYWLVAGIEPFTGSTVSESLALASHTEQFLPLSRRVSEYSGPFWDKLMHCMIANDPQDRFENAEELLGFLVGHSSTVQKTTRAIPNLLWNSKALTNGERTLSFELEKHLEPATAPTAVVLRASSRTALEEIIRRACYRSQLVEWFDVITFRPDQLNKFTNHLFNSESAIALVDNTFPWRRFSSIETASLLNLLRINGFGLGNRHLIILETTPTTEDSIKVSNLEHLFTVKELEPPQIDEGWLSGVFSGIPLDNELVNRLALTSHGGRNLQTTLAALDLAVASNLLNIGIRGEVCVDPEKEYEFQQKITGNIERFGYISEHAISYLGFVARTPDGIHASLRRELREHLGNESERELIDKGLINIDVSGKVQCSDVLSSFTLINGMAFRDDVLAKVVLRFAEGVEKSAFKVLLSDASRSSVLSALAAAKMLIHHGRGGAALCVLIDTHGHFAKWYKARWLDIRSQAWESVDRMTLASKDMEASLGAYSEAKQYVLAGRAALRAANLYLGGSNVDLYRASVKRAHELLGNCRCRSAMRLNGLVLAEDAHIARLDRSHDTVERIFHEILTQQHQDSRAQALAYRTMAVTAVANGNVSSARSNFSSALRSGRRSRDRRVLGRIVMSVMGYHFGRGFYSRSQRLARVVLKYETDLSFSERYALWTNLGGIAYEAGDVAAALRINIKALALTQPERDEQKVRTAAQNCALILLRMNRLSESLSMSLLSLRNGRSTNSSGFDPRLTASEAYLEIGNLRSAENLIHEVLAENPRATFKQSVCYRDLALLELLRDNISRAIEHCREAHSRDLVTQARDEALVTEWLTLCCQKEMKDSVDPIPILRDLEARARELKTWRLEVQFRLTRLQWDQETPAGKRLEELNGMISDCFQKGYAILELPMLQLKAELLIELGRLMEAQDVLREALARIKAVSSEFTDPELRRTYLADPRRRRFLELVKAARPA